MGINEIKKKMMAAEGSAKWKYMQAAEMLKQKELYEQE